MGKYLGKNYCFKFRCLPEMKFVRLAQVSHFSG